jgi:hypothetical protein
MATNKTATIIFKGDDQISPAIKGATASVAELKGSLGTVDTAAKQASDSIRENLVKQIEAARERLKDFAAQGLKIEQGQALAELNKLNRELSRFDLALKNADKSAVELKASLTASLNVARQELAKLSTQKITPEVQIRQEQLLKEISKVESQLKDVDKLIITLEIKTSALKNALDEIKTGISREIGAQITQGLAQIPSAIAATTLQFEKLQTTLKSTLGSQSAADEAFATIKAFAASTPFQVSEITASFIKLQNRGITPTSNLLKQLGDLASSQGKGFDQITEAILDASTGEFERLKEFGIQASKSGDEVTIAFKGVQKTVANTPESINAAIASLGNLQGVAGGMEAQSKTLGGALSNLQDTADTLAVAFGEELTPILLEIVKSFSSAAGGGENLAKSLGKNVGGAIKFLVDNSQALKTILELIVIQFGLVKLQALAAAIGIAATGGAALTAAGALTGLALAAGSAALAFAPLALAFAAIKGIEFAKFANDLKGFNDELGVATAGANIEGDAIATLGLKLRNLNQKRKEGKIVSESQRKAALELSASLLAAEEKRLVAVNALAPANDDQKRTQDALRIGLENSIKSIKAETKALAENSNATTQKARSEKEVEEAVKSRIEKEKRGLEDRARISGRAFEKQSNAEKDTFEEKSRTDKRTFEKQLNLDKEAFEDAQKADKKKFEDEQKADTKRFTDAQKADQKRFNAEEKASDKAYQKEKQVAQRAFDKEQQNQKEAFDKKLREENLAFDKTQDAAKKTADDQFAKRRLEIERKLQLDAAKTPEDKAKLEAEFKATDEKIAKEKLAFEQLKADELAFAEKQKADKIAFDAAQKAAQKAEEEAQKIAKQTFDDAQKLRDDEREAAKEVRKETFETQLNVKKEAFEAALNAKKEAFDIAQAAKKRAVDDEQNAKKQEFEDGERKKKEDFDTKQNLKKQEFEDRERKKKEAFEDNLKTLEKQFKAEERAKDIATAQQVAAIKSSAGGGVLGGAAVGIGEISPRAKGGAFRAGQQLLVGERGQELVTFGSGGYVSNATDTKQILSSNSKAPSSVSTARMEALLGQLVGKLDRPNVSVQTSENPSDVLIKIQREAARAAAMRSGI